MNTRIFAIVIQLILVLFTLGGAFTIAGSPLEAKQATLDAKRLVQFTKIKSSIESYYITERKLPVSLNDITLDADELLDPDTKKPFDYQISSVDSYQLCATFALDSTKNSMYNFDQKKYSKGYNCFDYEISKSTLNLMLLNSESPVPAAPATTDTVSDTPKPSPLYTVTGTFKEYETRRRDGDTYNVIVVELSAGSMTALRKYSFPSGRGIRNSAGETIFADSTKPGDILEITYSVASPDVTETIEIINKSR